MSRCGEVSSNRLASKECWKKGFVAELISTQRRLLALPSSSKEAGRARNSIPVPSMEGDAQGRKYKSSLLPALSLRPALAPPPRSAENLSTVSLFLRSKNYYRRGMKPRQAVTLTYKKARGRERDTGSCLCIAMSLNRQLRKQANKSE